MRTLSTWMQSHGHALNDLTYALPILVLMHLDVISMYVSASGGACQMHCSFYAGYTCGGFYIKLTKLPHREWTNLNWFRQVLSGITREESLNRYSKCFTDYCEELVGVDRQSIKNDDVTEMAVLKSPSSSNLRCINVLRQDSFRMDRVVSFSNSPVNFSFKFLLQTSNCS
ncbi:hypothetical protein HELRODRAFT_177995 [Helobdella robusta]|uniref:Uncharacterized protein n=1 Tax=Helobdella robusta TaxID=6412 RepID=T1FCK9_HELRO|nr:hypothetical protein HELRODRAFT_177995 [Helobdella robusta]ESN97562.1 hypothetical protein HELRODRAFT_177995 [Helobdella robusta]